MVTMTTIDVSADVRLSARIDGKVRAFADVTIPLNGAGLLKISGFSVIDSGGNLRVGMPSRKGGEKYFDVVTLSGRIRALVDGAILGEYRRLLDAAQEGAGSV